jgi:hypothetical protein
MKKCNGNSPSAYQTISRFCEESACSHLDDDQPIAHARPRRFSSALFKLLTSNPLRRKDTDFPG